jgi:hypothetical protein
MIGPPYPEDNSKHQQLNERLDRDENGTKMIAGVHFVTLVASATILAPSARRLFDARFRLVIALLSVWDIRRGDIGRGSRGTYVHLGRKAATIWAS